MFYAKPNPEWMRVVSTETVPHLDNGTVATSGMYILCGGAGFNTEIKISDSPIASFTHDGTATLAMRGDSGNAVVYRYLAKGQNIRAAGQGATMSLLA